MLVRVLYVSRADGPQTTTVTSSILATARRHNREHGITGVLGQGQGLYLQVLEGERDAVHRLYARIVVDRRHHDVVMLQLEEIGARRFAAWSMALVELSDQEPMVQLKHPEFDPYSASGADAMRLLESLLASSQRIEQPAS